MYLETPRLLLRNFQLDDVPALATILADPQVMKFAPNGLLSTAETQAKVAGFMRSYQILGFGKWAVIYKTSLELIGYCGIALEDIDQHPEREVGYRLATRYWGQGLATEAAAATVEYGLRQLEFPYLLGIVERANVASVRVLEKVGMHYTHETYFHGISMDVYRIEKGGT
jgi:[ribosomal protein S5]-alanine N-acetyltransferase